MSIQWHKATCPYCGLGCGLMVGVDAGRVVEVKGATCSLPIHYPPIFTHKDRLRKPMIRCNGKLVPVSWQEAIRQVASGFKRIIETHGPGAVAFYGGAINLTEEYYLMNKLVKAAILFFIAGNNMSVSVPVLFFRLLAARNKNKTKMIVVDPRRTETAAAADLHLQVRPGTDVALNNTLAHILLKEGFVNKEEVAYYTSGLSELEELVEAYPPGRGAQITGCPEEQIIAAARTIGKSRAMLTFWLQGYNHSTQAVFKNNTLHNLWLLTGNYCRPGAGPLSVTGECNALGNRWVGALANLLTNTVYDIHSKQPEYKFSAVKITKPVE